MRVLYAASEVYPFAKTGGLADVAGALPKALRALGHDVRVVLPYYRKVRKRRDPVRRVATGVALRFAGEDRPFDVLEGRLPGSDAPIWFIENEGYFEAEDDYYGTAPGSYGDAHLRFLYFSTAIPLAARALGFVPDVFHLNDWQTAYAAVLAKTIYHLDPAFQRTACLLTLHNMAYQGVFPTDEVRACGVEPALLSWRYMVHKGSVNCLKAGILFADVLNAVSRTYAREIQTPAFGAGLEELLAKRREDLAGVVNGVDTDVWNPETDEHIAARFSVRDLEGKRLCKEALLREAGLPATEGPVYACISRLTGQKGLRLILGAADRILADDDARLVVLGSGDPDLESGFRDAARRHPSKMAAVLKFDEPLSHRIEAGADIFLMPSRYEPCGLNQLISLRYGTVPIVRRTGGLADTVVDASGDALEDGTATGFQFEDATAGALFDTVRRARSLFDDKRSWRRLQEAGMNADWSWEHSAREYLEVYEAARKVAREEKRWKQFLSHIPLEPVTPFLEKPPEIPQTFDRDLVRLMVKDPRTLFASYETSGPRSRDALASVSEAARKKVRWFLRVTDHERRRSFDVQVSPLAHGYYMTVDPHAAYSAELMVEPPAAAPIVIAASGLAFVPKESQVHIL